LITISSSDQIPIEQHFKITAGPGAGKTHWLVNHIKNTIDLSLRLGKSRKIACITYTNIAVETILNRLGTESTNQVEVSTIHSFLYKHVVKPYLFYIAEEFQINISKVKGHDTILPRYSIVQQWLENHSRSEELKHPNTINQLLKLKEKKDLLFSWLSSVHYVFNFNQELILVGDDRKARVLRKVVNILEEDLISYKKLNWIAGRLDHDDVLFFSYELINRHPFILKVLRAKFPYFYIDEFQDTNPIQSKILTLLSKEETIVGVIGDPAQSIYAFQGAEIQEFDGFMLTDMANYEIKENRRSTNQIIDLLNLIRGDIEQIKQKGIDKEIPVLFIGNSLDAYNEIKSICGTETIIHTLSRDNPTANSMKFMTTDNTANSKLLIGFKEVDSNAERSTIIKNSIEAVEFARIGDYSNAIEKMKSNLSSLSEKEQINKSILILQELLKNYDNYFEKSIMYFYGLVKKHISMSSFRGGATQVFYNSHFYKDLSRCINYKEDTSEHRTIHKAKGDEFENVLLIPDTLDFLIRPDLNNDEEHRIYYVGLSRAISRLFIVFHKVSKKDCKLIEERYNIKVVDLTKIPQPV
jgi:DNA helicase II / ATP-dependent DNA helicase PcrA